MSSQAEEVVWRLKVLYDRIEYYPISKTSHWSGDRRTTFFGPYVTKSMAKAMRARVENNPKKYPNPVFMLQRGTVIYQEFEERKYA